MKIVLATGNRGKLKEFSQLVGEVEVLSLADFPDHPLVEENGKTFEENALKKARDMARYTGLIAVADDSGLQVDYLSGAPGIYSARFAGKPYSDGRNNEKLLHLLRGVPWEQRTARFVCALAIVTPAGEEHVVLGSCEGYILEDLRGNEGFGYDPLFYYPPMGKSFGQLDIETKNKISHRAKAFIQGSIILKRLLAKGKC